MAWCFSTRTSVTTVLTMHPCVSRCLRVNRQEINTEVCHDDVMTWKYFLYYWSLTHWGRVTHKCVSKLTSIGSDNGLSPGRRQAIIWTNAGILLIGPFGTNINETLIEIHSFSFKKIIKCIWKCRQENGSHFVTDKTKQSTTKPS